MPGEWINKMWYKNTMENYSALKRNENACCNLDENLEDIMLSEISQTQEDKYYMIPLM